MTPVNYILIASGSLATPQMEIIVQEENTPDAVRSAEAIVGQISLAGYYRFSLYDVRGDHKIVASFRVDTPKPVVTAKVNG